MVFVIVPHFNTDISNMGSGAQYPKQPIFTPCARQSDTFHVRWRPLLSSSASLVCGECNDAVLSVDLTVLHSVAPLIIEPPLFGQCALSSPPLHLITLVCVCVLIWFLSVSLTQFVCLCVQTATSVCLSAEMELQRSAASDWETGEDSLFCWPLFCLTSSSLSRSLIITVSLCLCVTLSSS